MQSCSLDVSVSALLRWQMLGRSARQVLRRSEMAIFRTLPIVERIRKKLRKDIAILETIGRRSRRQFDSPSRIPMLLVLTYLWKSARGGHPHGYTMPSATCSIDGADVSVAASKIGFAYF